MVDKTNNINAQKEITFDELADVIGATPNKPAAFIFGHARPSRAEQKKLAGALDIDYEYPRRPLGVYWLDK